GRANWRHACLPETHVALSAFAAGMAVLRPFAQFGTAGVAELTGRLAFVLRAAGMAERCVCVQLGPARMAVLRFGVGLLVAATVARLLTLGGDCERFVGHTCCNLLGCG